MNRAGFGIRLGAFLIDSVLIGILSWVIDLIMRSVTGGEPINPETGMPIIGTAFWVSTLLSIILAFAYYVWYPTKTNGQTLGKKFTKIRIQKLDGEPLTMLTLFLREFIGKTISSIILLIGYLMVLGKQKRALHDYIAGTVVIKD